MENTAILQVFEHNFEGRNDTVGRVGGQTAGDVEAQLLHELQILDAPLVPQLDVDHQEDHHHEGTQDHQQEVLFLHHLLLTDITYLEIFISNSLA